MKEQRRMRVLVVDDTEATRYAISRTLKSEGYEIIEAATGNQALELARQHLPDLITLDIHLPDIIGFEVCRILKSDPATSHIPVLQVSASYITSKDRIHGLEGGADSYLTHPFEPAVLIATVRALLRFRKLNENLHENEKQLRMVVESADLGMCDYNVATGELNCSERWKEIFALDSELDSALDSEDSLNCDHLLKRVHPDDRERIEQKARRAAEKPDIEFNEEFRLIWPDGSFRWVAVRGNFIFDSIGGQIQLTRVVGTALDTTERMTAQEALRLAKELAESANQAKSQFLANVSHEIRTPLGVIHGLAELLSDHQISERERIEYSSVISRNAELLGKLIDEILDLSKIEADRITLERLRFDLVEAVIEVISILKLKAQEKSIELGIHFESPLPREIETDPTRFRQILINLIGNALKFTERGKVLVKVCMESEPRQGEPVRLRFDVTDTGIGLSPDQQAKLFAPFSQADSSMTRRFGGSGLGLMLSRRLAREMGGEVEILRSEPGKGSTFSLKLEAGPFSGAFADADKAAAAVPVGRPLKSSSTSQPEQEQSLKGMKVLLVEDSPDNQVMFTRFLHLAGAQVDTADNGELGVKRALAAEYDLVLMDIQMPKMDGYEASKRLRSAGYDKPVIALTAHALKGERERCLEGGFSEYLTKPLKRHELIKTLQRYH